MTKMDKGLAAEAERIAALAPQERTHEMIKFVHGLEKAEGEQRSRLAGAARGAAIGAAGAGALGAATGAALMGRPGAVIGGIPAAVKGGMAGGVVGAIFPGKKKAKAVEKALAAAKLAKSDREYISGKTRTYARGKPNSSSGDGVTFETQRMGGPKTQRTTRLTYHTRNGVKQIKDMRTHYEDEKGFETMRGRGSALVGGLAGVSGAALGTMAGESFDSARHDRAVRNHRASKAPAGPASSRATLAGESAIGRVGRDGYEAAARGATSRAALPKMGRAGRIAGAVAGGALAAAGGYAGMRSLYNADRAAGGTTVGDAERPKWAMKYHDGELEKAVAYLDGLSAQERTVALVKLSQGEALEKVIPMAVMAGGRALAGRFIGAAANAARTGAARAGTALAPVKAATAPATTTARGMGRAFSQGFQGARSGRALPGAGMAATSRGGQMISTAGAAGRKLGAGAARLSQTKMGRKVGTGARAALRTMRQRPIGTAATAGMLGYSAGNRD